MPRIRSAPEALRYPAPADPNGVPAFELPTPRNRDRQGHWTVSSHVLARWHPANPQLYWGHGEVDEHTQMGVLWPSVNPMHAHPQLSVEIRRRSVYVQLLLNPDRPARRCAMLEPEKYHMSLLYVRAARRFSLQQMRAVLFLAGVFARARQLHVDNSDPYDFWLGRVSDVYPGQQPNSWNFALSRQVDRDWMDELVDALQQQVLFPILGQPRDQGPRLVVYEQRLPLHISWL